MPSEPGLHGLLVTYRRPRQLRAMLDRLARQRRPVDRLIVVDNSPSPEGRREVERHAGLGFPAQYVASPTNLGPAGAIALGMELALRSADDDDWIVLFDDDDPPPDPDTLASVLAFAEAMRRADPSTAAVGLAGARFDRERGRTLRLDDDELAGAVAVDYLGNGQMPFYRAGAVRAVGPFRADLFFGFGELEYGARLADAGFSLYADGDLWRRRRLENGWSGKSSAPSIALGAPTWRRYYSLRNLIWILRSLGAPRAAARVALVTGLAKPVANLPVHPVASARHLALNWRACRDGWRGRLGRTIDPSGEGKA